MLEVKVCESIDQISREEWNALCGTDYPFLRHEFLQALERSGCVSASTGWQPLHLRLEQEGNLVGVMPLYLKNHSYGEYVFDWAWADAYSRHGLDYYPKLLTAIPFTPSQGPRFGISIPLEQAIPAIAQAIRVLCERFQTSSWHGLFTESITKDHFSSCGMLPRLGTQYHWHNEGYENFDDFLSRFASRKRKNLKKERQKIREQGIEIRVVEGSNIHDGLLEEFYRCYQLTYLKRGQRGYLNLDFFRLIRNTLPQHLMMVVAETREKTVAVALSFKSSNTLYGRYWGSLDEYENLHFEACYYRGIEYCIEQGLRWFDPGAQGEHKIQRGFKPIETWSVHWIEEPGFRQGIRQFLTDETRLMRQRMLHLSEGLPFKADNSSGKADPKY
ncbi:GNAT family N-acetyltransferase [Nitrincola alkalilacustris]|uniref:GNAT family N-acetyltransferase n=1 Tax=Nitrincola alkalilacustris TaxID=1571224 RepID=UPI00124DB16D|nr:GNAT family N-acetyltransferase [Nitrincola alkalilacustris]